MDTTKLKKFAQHARRLLMEQVATKLEWVLAADSAARRENAKAVAELVKQVQETSREHVVEQVAYTWFNRFCALRFMDVNGYTRIRVVSPADEEQFQPEILAEAKMGHIDEARVSDSSRKQIAELLGGTATSGDPQQEAYRLLVVAECNSFHQAMPYLFERIADYTELLMPDDLLSGNSILAYTREAMTPDVCKDVEVIGWLYQFYISEKKDQVFDGMKKGKKITPDNIPAATQLFTPHWIVRYLLENSLGRLWMLNHPDSKLVEQMDYYVRPEQVETDFLRINKPEDIKICDPACGSGHMLTYAFDLLYFIYEEAGADTSEIPSKIFANNLYGIEIDERAGDLAAFALSMKARARQRRFFSKPIEPNICLLEKVSFSSGELDAYMEAVGRDLFTLDLRETLQQFEEANNFGSLIRPTLTNARDLLPLLESRDLGGQLFLQATHYKVLRVLRQADYLSQKYHVVVVNPPYMGSKGMNPRLGAWVKNQYPLTKADIYASFIERSIDLCLSHGAVAMITMQSWMFLSSYEKFRVWLLDQHSFVSMAHLGARAFDSIGGEVVSTTAFVVRANSSRDRTGIFIDLTDGESEAQKSYSLLETIAQGGGTNFHVAEAGKFHSIPGSLISYATPEVVVNAFRVFAPLHKVLTSREGLTTGSNEMFLRFWTEVGIRNVCFDANSEADTEQTSVGWFPYLKGGEYRKWAGNAEHVVNWKKNGEKIRGFVDSATGRVRSHNYNGVWAFQGGVTWSSVSSGNFCVRYVEGHFMFDATGTMGFPNASIDSLEVASYLNSAPATYLMHILAPTIRFQPGHPLNLPFPPRVPDGARENASICKHISMLDWDSYETSWGFSRSPLLVGERQPLLSEAYAGLKAVWRSWIEETLVAEQSNNQKYIEGLGLEMFVSPVVTPENVTLLCNPEYRYGVDESEAELSELQRLDSVREFVSYAVGCMFGRYSLDKPGLVLANQGDTLADYLRQVPQPTFAPDADNVIPLLDGEWFNDDITERFRSFLRLTFGETHYAENLRFIEEALGKDIRKFFLKDFYTDHVKRYKKRPIYWLFSSPKGSFNALIYLHRYRPDTTSVVLQYLRDFQEKLTGERKRQEQISISPSASQADKTRALKSIDSLKKTLTELDDYERDVLHPLATQQISIDLDDGVKVNYLKLGAALKKIPGLEAKEEE